MKYAALRDFDNFKKADLIPNEIVEDRLIRGRKIGLVNSEFIEENKELQETLNEVVAQEVEEILTEDSSDVSVTVVEEDTVILEEKPKKYKK